MRLLCKLDSTFRHDICGRPPTTVGLTCGHLTEWTGKVCLEAFHISTDGCPVLITGWANVRLLWRFLLQNQRVVLRMLLELAHCTSGLWFLTLFNLNCLFRFTVTIKGLSALQNKELTQCAQNGLTLEYIYYWGTGLPASKTFKFHYFCTSLNVADALTKSLGEIKLAFFRPQMLGTSSFDVSKAKLLKADLWSSIKLHVLQLV